MDDELVTSSKSYGEIFEEMCGWYMSLGMTYHDYWDGDAAMTKYYRDKEEHDRKRANFELWLQGAYVYEAIRDLSPILKPFVKNPKPAPYLSEPIPLNQKQKDESNRKKMQNGIKAMEAMMDRINKRFEKGGGHNGD